jgi:hypothetical protein
MQQKLAEKEKASKEENLRMLAQRAREGRTGMPPAIPGKPSVAANAAFKISLGAYGSGSDDDESEASVKEEPEDSGDDEAAKVRDQMRRDKRQDREREMRMSHMGTEQRMKQIARSVFRVPTRQEMADYMVQTTESRYFRKSCTWPRETHYLERGYGGSTSIQPGITLWLVRRR